MLPQPHTTLSWFDRAECKGLDTDVPARELCARCQVRPQCLSHALAGNIRVGRWGGYLTEERDALLDHNAGDVYAAVTAGADLRSVPATRALAAARARHPSVDPATRDELLGQLALEYGPGQ